MIDSILRAAGIGVLLMTAALAGAQAPGAMTAEQRQAEFARLPWQEGPLDASIGAKARLAVPAEARLLAEAHGARFLELTGNLPEAGNTVLVGRNWWATFSFSDVGYVKDDEKLDPDALLSTLQESDAVANEQRQRLGIAKLTTVGWAVPPHYDPETRFLEWGLNLRAEGDPTPVINYTVRMLGRSGYENVILVTSAETLQQDVAELKAILKGFDFVAGERYAEFKQGDRLAEVGLGALVLGGAAAAAAKSGWFKSLLAVLVAGWKLVAAAVVAGIVGLGRLMGRKKAG